MFFLFLGGSHRQQNIQTLTKPKRRCRDYMGDCGFYTPPTPSSSIAFLADVRFKSASRRVEARKKIWTMESSVMKFSSVAPRRLSKHSFVVFLLVKQTAVPFKKLDQLFPLPLLVPLLTHTHTHTHVPQVRSVSLWCNDSR